MRRSSKSKKSNQNNQTKNIQEKSSPSKEFRQLIINSSRDVGKSIQALRKLKNKHQDIDIANEVDPETGNNALHEAAKAGNMRVINFLINDCEVDLNKKNKKEKLPEDLAKTPAIKAALEKIKNERRKTAGPLVNIASMGGHVDVIKQLRSNGWFDANISFPEVNNKSFFPLFIAVQNNHLDLVKYLVNECQADVNAFSNDISSLHMTALQGNLPIVEFLLTCPGIQIDSRSLNKSATPLHFAAEKGHLEIVKALVEKGAEVDAKTNSQGDAARTPLQLAILYSQKLDVVKHLVEVGKADVNAEDDGKDTPLSHAARVGHLPICQFLIERGAILSAVILTLALKNKHYSVVHFLIQQKVEMAVGLITTHLPDEIKEYSHYYPETNITRLLDNLRFGNYIRANELAQAEKYIKEKQIDVDFALSDGATALHFAAEQGYSDLIKFLIANGANLNSKLIHIATTPLHLAAQEEHVEATKTLVLAGANVNCQRSTDGFTPLHIVIAYGVNKNLSLEVVRCLVEEGRADINLKADEKYGTTPFFLAVRRGELTIIKYLMDHGVNVDDGQKQYIYSMQQIADISRKTTFKPMQKELRIFYFLEASRKELSKIRKKETGQYVEITPLCMAVSKGHIEVVKILCNRSEIDIHRKIYEANTLLHIAAQNGDTEICDLLLQAGIGIDELNSHGMSALLTALNCGYEEMAVFLIKQGARIDYADEDDWNPFDYALWADFSDVIDSLLKREDFRLIGSKSDILKIAQELGRTRIVQYLSSQISAEVEENKQESFGISLEVVSSQSSAEKTEKPISEKQKNTNTSPHAGLLSIKSSVITSGLFKSNSKKEDCSTCTWLNGAITGEDVADDEWHAVRNHGGYRWWVPQEELYEQVSREERELLDKLLKTDNLKICGPRGENGLKHVGKIKQVYIRIDEQEPFLVDLKLEMKIKGKNGAARLLCAVFKRDTKTIDSSSASSKKIQREKILQNQSLIVPLIFLAKGRHDKRSIRGNKVIQISSPIKKRQQAEHQFH